MVSFWTVNVGLRVACCLNALSRIVSQDQVQYFRCEVPSIQRFQRKFGRFEIVYRYINKCNVINALVKRGLGI